MKRHLVTRLASVGFVTFCCLAVGCASQATPTTQPNAEQFDVQAVELSTPDGIARGQVAVIDLTDPSIEVKTLIPFESGLRLDLRTTESLVRDGTVDLAVNANYFGNDGIVGLSVVDGQAVNPARGSDPVLLIRDGSAEVRYGPGDLTGVQQAVAGVGPNATILIGTMLVLDGENLGKTARVEPLNRHPRTAVGVDRSGKQLILMVIDGRQPDHSVGVTLPELAEAMIAQGVDDAINLDGGGSSVLAWRDGSAVRTTQQSQDEHRRVPVHLGVRRTNDRVE